jgi:hypothetical protein
MNLRNLTAARTVSRDSVAFPPRLFPTTLKRRTADLLPQPFGVDGGSGREDEIAAAVNEAEALEVCESVTGSEVYADVTDQLVDRPGRWS